jgi:uncharacterized membrane protein required for colicin V production
MQVGFFIDCMIVAFMVFHTYLGWRRGLLWQVAGVASIAFGVILGLCLAPYLGEFISEHLTSNQFRAKLIGFLFVFSCVGLTLRLAAAWAEVRTETGLPKKERDAKRADDRILGGIFGALKGSVLALVFVAAGVSFYPGSKVWPQSKLAEPLAIAGSRLLPDGAVKEVRRWAAQSAMELSQGLDIK